MRQRVEHGWSGAPDAKAHHYWLGGLMLGYGDAVNGLGKVVSRHRIIKYRRLELTLTSEKKGVSR